MLQKAWMPSAVLLFIFIGMVVVGVYVHIFYLFNFFCSPCGHSCTISLCKCNSVLWWLLYKSRASQRAIEGCVLFIVSLVDCWTLHCCLFPIRFSGETLAVETLRRNYLLVIRSMLLQSTPHSFTFRSSSRRSKVWVYQICIFFLLRWKDLLWNFGPQWL